MKSLFWISAVFITYVYFGYPIWVFLRSRWWPQPWRQEAIFPMVSVVVPIHNGGEHTQAKLENLLGLDYPNDRLEITVISDGSQDATNEILARCADQRLHFLQYPERRGKAAALNLGFQEARGEIVVLTDVRQYLEPNSLRLLVSNFSDPSVGCVSGELILGEEVQPGTPAGVGFYWRYEKWIRKCEARIDSTVGVTGALYAVRRELLTTLPADLILDDVYQPMHVVRQGFRSVFDARARAWDSLPPTSRGEFRRKVRTLLGNYQLVQYAPWLLCRENRIRFQFVSHKLLRLWVPLFLGSLFTSSWWLVTDPFYLGLALLQSAFYICAGLGLWLQVKQLRVLLGVPAVFCLLNGAAIMGLINFLFRRGPLWRLWVPANAGLQQPIGSDGLPAQREGMTCPPNSGAPKEGLSSQHSGPAEARRLTVGTKG